MPFLLSSWYRGRPAQTCAASATWLHFDSLVRRVRASDPISSMRTGSSQTALSPCIPLSSGTLAGRTRYHSASLDFVECSWHPFAVEVHVSKNQK